MRNLRNSHRLRTFPFPLEVVPHTTLLLFGPVLRQPFAFERLSSSEVASALVLMIELVQRWKSVHEQPVLVVTK
jgi:hypothetical protein